MNKLKKDTIAYLKELGIKFDDLPLLTRVKTKWTNDDVYQLLCQICILNNSEYLPSNLHVQMLESSNEHAIYYKNMEKRGNYEYKLKLQEAKERYARV